MKKFSIISLMFGLGFMLVCFIFMTYKQVSILGFDNYMTMETWDFAVKYGYAWVYIPFVLGIILVLLSLFILSFILKIRVADVFSRKVNTK
jgi:TRAP-type C4-dicarboxylate transport system permease small subunit